MASHEKRTDLFTHLLRCEANRRAAGLASQYELRDGDLLLTIREMSRLCAVALKIYVVQPGVSKTGVTRDQLELVSVTENHSWKPTSFSSEIASVSTDPGRNALVQDLQG